MHWIASQQSYEDDVALNWVFGSKTRGKRKAGQRKKPPYETAREIAASGSAEERRRLAEHEDLEPEILYYFATDEAPEVRRTVAVNVGTPLQADMILAKDVDGEVRAELARKIGRLVPELDTAENESLAQMAMEILEVLARDELPRVRAIIAEELKNAANVPQLLIRRLASDLDEIVSVPVLEYSPLLNEADLLEIIARGMHSRALVAVARRRNLSTRVSDAVVARDDASAVGALLANKTARINRKTFDAIAEKAEMNPEWHNAMVYRDDLPLRTIMRIASFVNAALMEALIARNQHSKDIVDDLRKTVRERIERGDLPDAQAVTIDADGSGDDDPDLRRVIEDRETGALNENRIAAALRARDYRYVRFGLIELSGLPDKTVRQMLGTRSAKAMLAIAWKAGLSMAMAEKLQRDLLQLGRAQMLKAAADGGYPLSEADLDWYLESFFA